MSNLSRSFSKNWSNFDTLTRSFSKRDFSGSLFANKKKNGKNKNKELGLIFGWAIISNEKGKPYYDVQGDYIPEDSMLVASTEFMSADRDMKVMHSGKRVGTVVFAWPMTQEIADAMGIKTQRTGLMVAVKPDNKAILERFKAKQYTGFSIGGNRLVDEDVD